MNVRLDEIRKDWLQLVFRFRRVDGIRDADIERSLGGYFEEIDLSVEIRIEGLGFASSHVYGVYWLALKRPKPGSK